MSTARWTNLSAGATLLAMVMLPAYLPHNRFKESISAFRQLDPHLRELSQLRYQYHPDWWQSLHPDIPGIYILTGGRQVGKSTSCKLWIQHCLENRWFSPEQIFYLPCDEIYDAPALSEILRYFLDGLSHQPFLLIIDEITYVKNWDRTIKALADEGCFRNGLCLLTGSDTLILKEAASRFPGRRGKAEKTDFHLYPLSFSDYVTLRSPLSKPTVETLSTYFQDYLLCGGYLRAINDLAEKGEVTPATYSTYEQWVRGDFLKRGKNEDFLLALLHALYTIGVSQISYSKLTQKIGLLSKETCIDYCQFLERMDILITLPAFDQNRKQGFPRKDKKFHFTDPFIYRVLHHWLKRSGYLNASIVEGTLVEASVASECHRLGRTFYFKGQGEIDVIWLHNNTTHAIEVKWTQEISPHDLKMLKQFKNSLILSQLPHAGTIDHIRSYPVYQFLYLIHDEAFLSDRSTG